MSDLSSRILYEDNHLIIVNKRPGELVQGDKTGDVTLADRLREFIRLRDQKPGNVFMGVPHRLDRPVSGIVIFAKTSKCLSRMSDVFRQRSIDKIYWAITENAPAVPSGRLTHFMMKNEKQNKSYISETEKKGYKPAVLEYEHLMSSDRYHLVQVKLETGRHHQIRAQLAHIGAVIKGDLKYGASRSNPGGDICLHSRQASFVHPVSHAHISVVAPCPDEPLWQFFERHFLKT